MAQYSEEKLRLPLIRRVFRQEDTFVCGLCKTDYKSYGAANSCMNQCWFDVHHFYPVVKRKRERSSWVFRCLFCCRDYPTELNAFECAKNCMGDRNKAQVREQLLNEAPLPPPARPVSRLMMLTRVIALPPPKPTQKAKKKKSNASAAPLGEVAIVEKGPYLGLNKASFKTHWVRKGEKYQCTYCKVIAYTKAETETCFEGHFKEDGYEKVVSTDPN